MSTKPHATPAPPINPRERADHHRRYFYHLNEWANHLGDANKRKQLLDAEKQLVEIYIVEAEPETR